ncbi:MAG: phosphoesterase RecJ protein [Candidatus Parcubacteria bacterium]|nr:phosphoesterase RecJ protein [Candidatus Parcubacteria bacterium]
MTSDTASDISPIIREKAPLILSEIQKAKSILLHCHPSPDPDSVGSALAMRFAIEQLGERGSGKVTIIAGDSAIPQAFMHFPGAADIVAKNFFELDLSGFDLFIVQDSSKAEMVSKLKPIEFPEHLKIIVIDHHNSNSGYGAINLVEPSYPATAQVLFDLFWEWKIKITPEIAANLFMGIYTDTGGFKYTGTTSRTFMIASALAAKAPDFPQLISAMENSITLQDLAFQGLALSSIESLFAGRFALSVVPFAKMQEKNIEDENASAGMISSILRRIGSFDIVGACIETEPNVIKFSFRSKDGNAYDVSKLAVALGGGGHKAAAGTTLNMPLEEAKKAVVAKAKELYNL